MDARNNLYHGILCFAAALAMLAGAQAQAQTSATLTLAPGSLSVPEITLSLGQTEKLVLMVGGVQATNVTWSLIPTFGSIANNVYTAPKNLTQPELAILTGQSGGQMALAILNLSTSGPAQVQPLAVSPASTSLSAGGSVVFTSSGAGFSSVAWNVSPAVGRMSNGLYTAPATITSPQTVSVTATNVGNPSQVGYATIYLIPTATAPPAPTPPPSPSAPSTAVTALTPSSASLTASGSKGFSFSINGAYQVSPHWSIVPSVGTIVNGLYTAPASITTSSTVTVIATSEANSSVTASASVTLVPNKPASTPPPPPPPPPPATVTVTVVPSLVTLNAGGSGSFTANVTGSSNTAVTWSISPPVGSLSNGIYTAPASVSSVQTITLTATSSANSSSTGRATIVVNPVTYTLSVSPTQASLGASKTQQFTATQTSSAGIGGSGPPSVQWSVSPAIGTVSSTGLYTSPASIASQQTIMVTATSASLTASASVTLTPSSSTAPSTPTPPSTPPTTTTTNIMLPLEVMGPRGTTGSVSFSIPSGSNLTGTQQLALQIHGLKYQTEASVKVNSGNWIPLNSSTVTLLGLANTFGGIGGGFATLNMTMNLPAGSITTGTNTLTFQFLGTDGNVSGFRVLSLNVLATDGSQLISQSVFTEDDPSTWQPPLTSNADIQTGQTLWTSAPLMNAAGVAIHAHCSDCHAVDGRDLKYFNYTNNSIVARSVFHGLTTQQGEQIASYIRTLNAPAPASAHPWNPPYQPGPGLDSLPVTDWAAGAGLSAVVDSDAAMIPYVMPNGSTANWAKTAYLNQREIPIDFQLLDWNRWLPTVHPMDVWGSTFTSSAFYQQYLTIRSRLSGGGSAAYLSDVKQGAYWPYILDNEVPFFQPLMTAANFANPTFQAEYYAAHEWWDVKLWELNQQYGLEGLAKSVYGPNTKTDRAWYGNVPFHTGPGVTGMPRPSAGIGNGLSIAEIYHSFAWYQLQLILNDGQGVQEAVDWPYAIGYPTNDLTWNPGAGQDGQPRIGTSALLLEWMVKALQYDDLNSFMNPGVMVEFPAQVSTWSGIPASQKVELMNAYTTTWLNFYGPLNTAGFKALPMSSSSNQGFTTDPTQLQFGQFLIYGLPQLKYQGVDTTLLTQIATWAGTIWPSYNWLTDLNETCHVTNGSSMQVGCH